MLGKLHWKLWKGCDVLAHGPENKARLMRQDQDGGFINLPKTSTSCTNPNIENWLCDKKKCSCSKVKFVFLKSTH